MGLPEPQPSRESEISAARARSFDTGAGAAVQLADPQQQLGTLGRSLVTSGPSPTRVPLQGIDVQPILLQSMDTVRSQRLRPLSPQEQAEQVVAEARETARSMLAQAREVVAAERTRAVEQGYQEGFAKGVADADAEMAGLLATCEQVGLQVAQERERVLTEHEPDLVRLAIAIARRIVNAEVSVDESLVVEACRGAMRKAFQRDSLQVLVHPADLELLRSAGPELARELGGISQLEFVEERRIERGGVVVRTPAGEIDGTIAGKAERIELALREGIEQRRAEQQVAPDTADLEP